jgi:hypothetical protein
VDLWQVLGVVVRRWWVVLPLLVLTGYLADASRSGFAFEYQTEASVVFVRGPGQLATNPLQNTGLAAIAMKIVLESSDARSQVSVPGPARAYEIKLAPRSSILSLSVRGRTSQEAVRGGEEVLDILDEQLDAHQMELGVPERNRTVTQLLDAPDSTLPLTGDRKKTLVGILALGVAATLTVAVLVDDLLLRRHTRDRRGAPGLDGGALVQRDFSAGSRRSSMHEHVVGSRLTPWAPRIALSTPGDKAPDRRVESDEQPSSASVPTSTLAR